MKTRKVLLNEFDLTLRPKDKPQHKPWRSGDGNCWNQMFSPFQSPPIRDNYHWAWRFFVSPLPNLTISYVRIRHIHLKLPPVKLRQEASHILTYHLERNASLPLIHDRTLVIYDNGMVQQWLGGPLSALSKFLGRCCNGFPQTWRKLTTFQRWLTHQQTTRQTLFSRPVAHRFRFDGL